MSIKKLVGCLMVAGLALTGSSAFAVIGTIDPVPAATLLLPYFEVELTSPAGAAAPPASVNTLFSINNASAAPALAHVTIWTDWSVPILDFDVYLTGFDVQTISLSDIFNRGVLPRTGENTLISPRGAFSINSPANPDFPGCTTGTVGGQPPIYNAISGTFLSIIRAAATGVPIPAGAAAGRCAASGFSPYAIGYITIDSVSRCSQEFPDNTNYFVNGGTGTANNNNLLWGDYFLVDVANNFAQGELLVSIEADGVALLGPGSCDSIDFDPTTFYCRYGGAPNIRGEDNREALGSLLGSRYLAGGAFTGGTQLYAYRDPNTAVQAPVTCGLFPSWFPLQQDQLVVFDEQENPILPETGPSGFDPAEEFPFVNETTCAEVGTDITTLQPFGWVYMNLNGANNAGEFNQAWVFARMSAAGLFSVGFDAINFNNLTLAHTTPSTCSLGAPPPVCSITIP